MSLSYNDCWARYQLAGVGGVRGRLTLRVMRDVVDDVWRWGAWRGAGDGRGGYNARTGDVGGVLQVGNCLLLSQGSGQLLQRSGQ